MRIFAIDTATWHLSAAVVEAAAWDDYRVLARWDQDTEKGMHSELLPGLVVRLLDAAGLTLRDVDALVAGLGPGSFTGLRTGLATLKGIAYGASRPLVGVSTLASMALAAADDLEAEARSKAAPLLVPVLDARRGQVYTGGYRFDRAAGVVSVREEAVCPPAVVQQEIDATPAILFGGGLAADPVLAAAASARPDLPQEPSSVALARLGHARVGPYRKEAVLALQPAYVRRRVTESFFPQAEH